MNIYAMTKIKKTLKTISKVVLALTLLNLYSFCVYHVSREGQKLGPFTKTLRKFASFPRTVHTVLTSDELRGVPPTYVKRDPSFKNINKLSSDLFGINSFYDMEQDLWDIKLFNFKNDSIIHKWRLTKEFFVLKKRQFKNSEPRNCIVLPDRSLIASCDETSNLYRLDKNSNIIWHNTAKIFHHSLNLAAAGEGEQDIWVCSSAARGFNDTRKADIYSYRDDFITKISVETGQILFDKSVSEILIENGYKNFVYGFSNQVSLDGDIDPIHLNDIEPVLHDTQYWKKGDLFLSLRNRSLVFLYRPGTNNIIRLIYGPFLHQHDVDIISANEISLFNNNITTIGSVNAIRDLGAAINVQDELVTSEILIYNFEDSTYRKHLQHQFDKEKISTITQGFHKILNSGDVYVENHNQGKLYIMNDDEILLKKDISTPLENMVEVPHWIRIYENVNF